MLGGNDPTAVIEIDEDGVVSLSKPDDGRPISPEMAILAYRSTKTGEVVMREFPDVQQAEAAASDLIEKKIADPDWTVALPVGEIFRQHFDFDQTPRKTYTLIPSGDPRPFDPGPRKVQFGPDPPEAA